MNIVSVFKPSHLILNRIQGILNQIDDLTKEFRSYSDLELKHKTQSYLKRIELGESMDDLLPEALATVREACYRAHGMFAYRTQLTSALIIYGGNFAEMKTGEGKTLTIALAAYIASLEGKGVHVVTVNDYLVKRDAEFCRKILNFLGITVGFITSNLSKELKKKMYACHVTYTTNSELAFDYLRDNMVYSENDILIPKLHFAIIDEGDSILIDEARTPLIISGPAEEGVSKYIDVHLLVKDLKPEDYIIDHETKTISLQSTGILKIEKALGIPKLYVFDNSELIHKIQNALVANFLFENGKEYIVATNSQGEEEIIIVDYYTGRLLYGQTYNAGLHQAIQAKEWIRIKPENKIVANITYQSFFRLYNRIAALSGTAISEAQEFSETYNMIVVQVPTNKPVIRKDLPDIIFGTQKAKIKGIVDEIKRHYITGQPVLVGTSSVFDSERICQKLIEQKIPCEILNAKNHDKEGLIIAQAGRKHAVTIATNIAGRGVDIKLTDEVKKLGGLFVLGTDRNESRRIDNQLRGRSGRQGDPGKSIFFISLEDDIFKRFGGDRFDKLAKKVKDEFFDSKFISKTLTNIQKKIQSINFDTRKNLVEYSEILSKQQQLIYKQRYFLLTNKNNQEILIKVAKKIVKSLMKDFVENNELKRLNVRNLIQCLNDEFFFYPVFKEMDFEHKNTTEIEAIISDVLTKALEIKKNKYVLEQYNDFLKRIFLISIDEAWQWHLDFVTKLRNNVHFHSLEQKSPLNVFIEKIGESFEELLILCGKSVVQKILNIKNAPIGEEITRYLDNKLHGKPISNKSKPKEIKEEKIEIDPMELKNLNISKKIKKVEEIINNSYK
ncbi:preprotein translocase subunit SecA [Candidatus Mycoplasma haematohominis]|uniref:Protein translocase subunit SecA n=1 Tax=Candidatus Mycoplasma haematohominis TaxID=1494318 RepID=A0A478FPH0_9MOLU|nr:preprotein translocase subunit SecA [Candidatus Mycoplasma haemohominis]